MHSIERYGIVALLFLVVTVVAVLMWDGNKGKKKHEAPGASSAAAATARPDATGTEPHVEAESARRMSLLAGNQPGPLQRRPRANGALEKDLVKDEPPAPLASDASSKLSPEGAPGAAPLQASSQAPLETSLQSQAPREQPAPEEIIGLHADPPRGAPAAAAAATHAYTVRPGDTLSEIAQHELGSSRRWQELVAANPGLDPAKLHVGKTIQVPGAASAASPSTKPSASPSKPGVTPETHVAKSASPAAGKTWKVGKGENLWRIAERALGDGKRWGEIAKLNPGVNPDRLVLGQVLALPGASAAPSGKKSDAATTPRVAKTSVKQPSAKEASAKKASAPVLVASAAGDERGARRGGKVK